MSGADETVSLGDGIEHEVIQTIFVDYKRGRSEWFIEHTNQLSTIATSHFVLLIHKQCMSILGAISALSLLQGMSARPLDPIFLHFLIHSCDLHAIHVDILGEWHPIFK